MVIHRIEGYNSETEEYTAQARTGRIVGWGRKPEREREKLLMATEGILMEQDTQATEGWDEEGDNPPRLGLGWWVRVTRIERKRKRVHCRILGEGEGPGTRKIVGLEDLDEVMEGLETGPRTRRVEIEEGWLGRSGFSSTAEMHPAVMDYWRHDAEGEPPEGVRQRLERDTTERAKMGRKRRRTEQRTITGTPMSQAGASMLPKEGGGREAQQAVQCRLIYGQETVTEDGMEGRRRISEPNFLAWGLPCQTFCHYTRIFGLLILLHNND